MATQDPATVAGDHAGRIHPALLEKPVRGHIGRSHPDHRDADRPDIFPHHLQGVQQGREQDRPGALLVVVPHRDPALAPTTLQHPKAFGHRDIFQIDAAEGGFQQLDRANQLIGVSGAEADRHRIHAAEILEEQRLAFHDRQAGLRADVAQSKHARAVGDDGDRIPLVGVLIDPLGLLRDRLAGGRHAGRVPDRKILEGPHRTLRQRLHLAAVMGVQPHGRRRGRLGAREQFFFRGLHRGHPSPSVLIERRAPSRARAPAPSGTRYPAGIV